MFGKLAKGAGAPRPRCSIRPCLADGKPGLFHRWVDVDQTLLKINAFVNAEAQERYARTFRDDGVVPHCCSLEVVRCTFALVEYPDGSVGRVKPELIQFLDRKEG